jgi:hypothetical protein
VSAAMPEGHATTDPLTALRARFGLPRDRWDAWVAYARAQIRGDVRAGRVPADVEGFDALHDSVDANFYGNVEAGGGWAPWPGELRRWTWETLAPLLGALHEALDAWIRAGGLRNTEGG